MQISVATLMERLVRGFLFHNAPACILIVTDSALGGALGELNAGLAAMNMELMAEALELGTVHVGLFTRPANANAALREQLGIQQAESISVCLALGYPDVNYLRSVPRKAASVIWR
jgi:nitroreductase